MNLGEDVYFFRRTHEAGMKIYVDHGLFRHVGHVSATTLMIADALADKEELMKRYTLSGGST